MQRVWSSLLLLPAMAALGCAAFGADAPGPRVQGWLHWRGPQQNGTSQETHLPDKWERGGTADLWSVPIKGRGTPVITGNRVYAWGYRGEGPELREVLACLDAGTGKSIWEH